MQPLSALLLTDGRPGHYQRAEGILAAIGRERPVSVKRLETRRSRLAPAALLAAALRHHVSPARILTWAFGIDASRLPPSDLVISAGGNTLAANICAARILKAPNIFYGHIRQFQATDFSLVLTSYDAHATWPRHRMAPLVPVPLDPDQFPAPAQTHFERKCPPRTGALLIGGPAGTFRFRPDEWQRILDFVCDLQTRFGTQWIVANSRRTPADVSDDIARRAGSGALSRFIDVRKAGPGTLQNVFAAADIVLCTDDSSSMITEAIWLRRPVIGLAPEISGFHQSEAWYRAHLVANNWTRSIPIAALDTDRLFAVLKNITPLKDNALDALAVSIKECMPALFRSGGS